MVAVGGQGHGSRRGGGGTGRVMVPVVAVGEQAGVLGTSPDCEDVIQTVIEVLRYNMFRNKFHFFLYNFTP